MVERDNGNVHRAAAKIIVSKSRAARGSVCNVLLSRGFVLGSVLARLFQHDPVLASGEFLLIQMLRCRRFTFTAKCSIAPIENVNRNLKTVPV